MNMNKKWLCISYMGIIFFSAFCVLLWIRTRSKGASLAYLLEHGTYKIQQEKVDKRFIANEYHASDELAVNSNKENPGCKFGFGFLKRLIKKSKEKNSPLTNHNMAVPAKRPISGALRQKGMCVDSMDGPEGSTIGIYSCHGQGRNQEFTITPEKMIKSEGKGDLCLSAEPRSEDDVILKNCNTSSTNQKWLIDSKDGKLQAASDPQLCLDSSAEVLSVLKCADVDFQKWTFIMTEVLNLELQLNQGSQPA